MTKIAGLLQKTTKFLKKFFGWKIMRRERGFLILKRDFERKKEQQKEQRLGYSNSRYSDRRRTESRTTKTKEKEIQQQRIR